MAASLYTPFSTEESGGGGGTPFSVRASAADFGGQVGQSIENAGKQAFDLSIKYAEEASEAKANDILANQWAPTAAKLRTDYDSLQGPDKVHGYETYIGGLKSFQQDLIKNETNPHTKQILSNYTTRHTINETESASRELASWQKQFNNESTWSLIKTQSNYASGNYNNPQIVNSVMEQNDAQIDRIFIDNGHDPNSPAGSAIIKEAKRTVAGDTAVGMITRAVQSGDTATANSIRSEYGTVIPGYKQLQVDDLLHVESIRQSSAQSVAALTSGAPLPPAIGAPPTQVQAVVANSAHSSGLDVNHALTILRIESSNGQNVGKRGTIGQTGGGGTLEDQADDLVREAAKSKSVADKALGRESTPWEQYICYQQGEGGGPALLKAMADNPTAKAVDVLSPLYKSSKVALSAVADNGGNATMTSGDFVDFLKTKYEANAKRAACDFPRMEALYDPGKAILQAHETTGETVQPGATPIQIYQNFNKKAPGMIERINAIPNVESREGVMREFKKEESSYQAAAQAYSGAIQLDAQKLAVNSDFTSTDQIPAELRAQLIDLPETMQYMQQRAEYNQSHASGAVTKDMREYGAGFYDLFKSIHAEPGSPDKITNVTQLQSHVGKDGDLTVSGYDKLVKELQSGTPEGEGEGDMKKAFFAAAKVQISGKNDMLGIQDPRGELLFSNFLTTAIPAYEKGRSEGKTPVQLLNEDSPDYIGNMIPKFKRSLSQMTADMMQDYGTGERSLASIIQDVQSGKITSDQGKSEAEKLGLIRIETIAVPRPE